MNIKERTKKLRSSKEYRDWKRKVLKRDRKICVLCGSKEKIEVDHIKSFALYPTLALDIENGRCLCHDCHKKTDTYGSFSIYKGNGTIHPILSGDLLEKIKQLPETINRGDKEKGLFFQYKPQYKQWIGGYECKNVNLISNGNSIEIVVDNIFEILKNSSTYSLDIESEKLEEEIKNKMKQNSTKVIRHQLYKYVMKLLGRKLTDEETQKIKGFFVQGVKSYYEAVNNK